MTIELYADHHVKAAIVAGLRRRGVDVLTCAEDKTENWKDPDILQRATELGRAVFTQDDDFLAIADAWLEEQREFAGLVFAQQRRITIGQAIDDLELIAKVLQPGDLRNRIEFLPF